MTLAPGLRATVSIVVGDADTAAVVGSGEVPVLATPRLLALAEAATVQALRDRLAPGQTSVGTRVELHHRAASPVGAPVEVTAELTEVDGRRLVFTVAAHQRDRLVADGTVERFVVDTERFLAKLQG